ncbi:probable insulin-like peptide 3 [Drosophila biarmipes]|uniref:probable insulin-like peptide 3 n=1 Tax=Drosophila biarmipes TaxID=125945 RepID=UPI0007E6CAE5|nr:probable insulin-like peptide 3 [Drosophila biarmipes]
MGTESGIMWRNRERRFLLPSLLLLILMIGSVQASMKLCGSKLPEALSRLCVYGFNAMTKRTFDPMNFNLVEAGSLDLGFDDRSLLERLFLDGSAQMLKTRRLREGVFDECCLKSCSMDELLRYCASKPKT